VTHPSITSRSRSLVNVSLLLATIVVSRPVLAGGGWLSSTFGRSETVDLKKIQAVEEKQKLSNMLEMFKRRNDELSNSRNRSNNMQVPSQQQAPFDAESADVPPNLPADQNGPTPTGQSEPSALPGKNAPLAVVQPTGPVPSPSVTPPLRILLPYDEGAATNPDVLGLVDLEEIERLECPSPVPSPSPTPTSRGALIRDGVLKARVEDRRVRISATYHVEVDTDAYVALPLALSGSALDQATCDGRPLLLTANREAVLEGRGEKKIEISYSTGVSIKDEQGEFELDLPQAPILSLELVVPRERQIFDLSTGQWSIVSTSPQETVARAWLPPGPVKIRFATKPPEREESKDSSALPEARAPFGSSIRKKAQVNGAFHTEYSYENRILTARTVVAYEIFPPGVDALTLSLPEKMDVVSVSDGQGKSIQAYSVSRRNGQNHLTAQLPTLVTGSYGLTIIQKEVLSPPMTDRTQAVSVRMKVVPAALEGVARAIGSAALRVPEDLRPVEGDERFKKYTPMSPDKLHPSLRAAFRLRPDHMWQWPDSQLESWGAVDFVATRLPRATMRTFKIEKESVWTLLTDSGMALTRSQFQVYNTQQQFLSVRLPPGSLMQGTTVAERPVTPGKGPGTDEYLIPLILSPRGVDGADLKPFFVEVIYATQLDGSLTYAGHCTLALPCLEEDLGSISWRLFLPEGYAHAQTSGGFHFAGGGHSNASLDSSASQRDRFNAGSRFPTRRRSPFEQQTLSNSWIQAQQRTSQSPAFRSAESSPAGLLPIRLVLPDLANGSLFTKATTGGGAQGPRLTIRYCRTGLLSFLQAILNALVFLCSTGLILAVGRGTSTTGPLIGVLFGLGGLTCVRPLSRSQSLDLAGLVCGLAFVLAFAVLTPVRNRLAVPLVLLACLAGTPAARSEVVPTVLIPYEKEKVSQPLDNSASPVLLPEKIVRELREHREARTKEALRKEVKPPAPPVAYVITRGDISAEIEGAVARLKVTYSLRILDDGWQRIPLVTGDLTVGPVLVDDKPGSVFVEENDEYFQQEMTQNRVNVESLDKADACVQNVAREITTKLLLRGKGEYTVRFEAEATVVVDSNGVHRLKLSPPAFPQGTMTATFAGLDLNIDVKGVVKPEISKDAVRRVTTLVAPIALERPLELHFTDKASREPQPAATEEAPGASTPVSGQSPAPAPAVGRAVQEASSLVLAKTITKLTLDEASLRGSVVYNFEIHGRGVSSLSFTVPSGLTILDVKGKDVQRYEEKATTDQKTVLVDLSSRVSGQSSLILNNNPPHNNDWTKHPRIDVQVPVIHCLESRFESGILGIEREGTVEVAEKERDEGLDRVEPGRLDPSAVSLLGGQILMSYSHANPAWRLVLSLLRHGDVDVQGAVIDLLDAETEISEERIRTTINYTVRNSSGPVLRFLLPEEAVLDAVRVGGVLVPSPGIDNRWYVVSLKTGDSSESRAVSQIVKIEYHQKISSKESSAAVRLSLARVDLSVIKEGVRWTITLPEGMVFSHFAGAVRPEPPTDFLNPFHAVGLPWGNSVILRQAALVAEKEMTVEFRFCPTVGLVARTLMALVFGFLMAAAIVSGLTWIDSPLRGFPRLVFAALMGVLAIWLEEHLPGTGPGLYGGGLAGALAPIAVRMFRKARRWTGGVSIVLLGFATGSGVFAQSDDAGEPSEVPPLKAVKATAGTTASGWIDLAHEFLVPCDRLLKGLGAKNEWVVYTRSLAEETLLKWSQEPAKKPQENDIEVAAPASSLILSGFLKGRASESWVSLDATYVVSVFEKGIVRIGFNPREMFHESLKVDGKDVPCLSDSDSSREVASAINVFVGEPGIKRVTFKLKARVDVLKEVSNVQLAIPTCPSTDLELTVPIGDPLYSVVPCTAVVAKRGEKETTLITRLKYSKTLFVRWRERQIVVARPSAPQEGPTLFDVSDDLRARLEPGMVRTAARFKVQVRSGALSNLTFLCPPGVEIAGVTGPDIEDWKANPATGRLVVHFRSKMRGQFSLGATLFSRSSFKPMAEKGLSMTEVPISSVKVEGAQAQSGHVRLHLPAGEDVRESVRFGPINQIDPSEATCADSDGPGDRVYRYVKPDWKLTLQVVRHREMEISSTRVRSGVARLLVPRDGPWFGTVTYEVENNTRQFLKAQLPPSGVLLGVTVSGQPRQPSVEDKEILLPLAKSEESSGQLKPFLVEVAFAAPPEVSGRRLVATLPRIELPIDLMTVHIATPPEIFLYGESPSVVARQAALSSVAERLFCLEDLPKPYVVAAPFLGLLNSMCCLEISRQSRMSIKGQAECEMPGSAARAHKSEDIRVFGRRPRKSKRYAPQAAMLDKMQRESRTDFGGSSIESEKKDAAKALDEGAQADVSEEIASAGAPAFLPSAGVPAPMSVTPEVQAAHQQMADFQAIIRKTGAGKGAIPIDIQLPALAESGRVSEYSLTLVAPNQRPRIELCAISVRWIGAIAGVVFFVVPVSLISLALGRGATGRIRFVTLVLLVLTGLVAMALTLWGIDALSFFLVALPTGVLAVPILRLNRSLGE